MARTVIIGGGITGLALAHALHAAGSDYFLIEGDARWGGKIRTRRWRGFTLEEGPDSCNLRSPHTARLIAALELEPRLLAPQAERIYIWDRERLRPLPEGWIQMRAARLEPLLRTDLISWPGKLRMGWEYFVKARPTAGDESLAAFVRRRLGREALNKVVGPLFAGIHAADPEKLSLRCSLPLWRELEQQHGGVIRGLRARQRRGVPAASGAAETLPPLAALDGGMQSLVEALVRRLDPERLRLATPVVRLERIERRWAVVMAGGGAVTADNVVLAVPADVASELLRGLDCELADRLAQIPYVSTATVSLAYRAEDVPRRLAGSGWMVARGEASALRGCTWTSSKFPAHAPPGTVLLRVFLGGAGAETAAESSGPEMERLARRELWRMLAIRAQPLLAHVAPWRRGQPQYLVGHQQHVAEMEQRLQRHPGLHFAGSGFHGSGIPNCLASAERIRERLQAGSPPRPCASTAA